MEVLLQLHNRGSILKNVPLDSLLCCALICAALCTCARIQLLSVARPGVSVYVADDTLARHLPKHLYTLLLVVECSSGVL